MAISPEYQAGIDAAKALYPNDYQRDMRNVAAIIAMTAMDAYEIKKRKIATEKRKARKP